jgi:hypothetical protein
LLIALVLRLTARLAARVMSESCGEVAAMSVILHSGQMADAICRSRSIS